jgi:hypothetical protein
MVAIFFMFCIIMALSLLNAASFDSFDSITGKLYGRANVNGDRSIDCGLTHPDDHANILTAVASTGAVSGNMNVAYGSRRTSHHANDEVIPELQDIPMSIVNVCLF